MGWVTKAELKIAIALEMNSGINYIIPGSG